MSDVVIPKIGIKDFQEEGARILAPFQPKEHPPSKAECEDFDRAVDAINQLVSVAFKSACILARRQERMEDVAAIWRDVVVLCDQASDHLEKLTTSFPRSCGSEFDGIIDYREAAQDRMELHL